MTADGRAINGREARAESFSVRRVSVTRVTSRQVGLRWRHVGAGPWAGHRADQDVALDALGLPDLVAATAFLVREVFMDRFISKPVGAGKAGP